MTSYCARLVSCRLIMCIETLTILERLFLAVHVIKIGQAPTNMLSHILE